MNQVFVAASKPKAKRNKTGFTCTLPTQLPLTVRHKIKQVFFTLGERKLKTLDKIYEKTL